MATGDLRNSLSRADGNNVIPKRFKNNLGLTEKMFTIETKNIGSFFVLDHPTNSILDGTNILDDSYTVLTTVIKPPNNILREEFSAYDLYNSASSTATLNAFEVLFDTDEELISDVIYQDSVNAITEVNFDFSSVNTNLDFDSDDEIYLSNNGTTWTLASENNVLSSLTLTGNKIYYKIKSKNDSRYIKTVIDYKITTLIITFI